MINVGSFLHRILATGLLAAVVVSLSVAAVWPAYEARTFYRAEMTDLQHRITQYRRLATEQAVLQQEIASLEELLSHQSGFLPLTSESIAAADLQHKVTDLVTASGGQVRSTQMVNDRTEDPYTRVALNMRVNGSVEMLQALLHGIESATPYLFVDELRVQYQQSFRSAMDGDSEGVLDIGFQVYGFMRQEE